MNFILFIVNNLKNEKHDFFNFQSERPDISPEPPVGIEQKIALINIKRLVPFASMLFLIEVVNQIIIFFTTSNHTIWTLHFAAGIFMLSLTVSAIFLSYRLLNASVVSIKCCRLVTRIFWWLFSFGMLAFILLELYSRKTSNNFFYLLILTAAFPLFPRKESALLFTLDTVVTFPFAVYLGLSAQELLQFPLIAVFAWILSRILYNYLEMNELMLEQLKISNQKLSDLANTDPLTVLLNRRGIQKQLQTTISSFSEPVRVGFLMVDIDYFKRYNDRFGHEQGDQCLKKIAGAIQRCAVGENCITSRFGGEEFLIALIGCTESDMLDTALRLQKDVRSLGIAAADDEVSPYVTISIGAAAAADFDFTTLYEQSDKALYLAKKSGRNCVAMAGRIYSERWTAV